MVQSNVKSLSKSKVKSRYDRRPVNQYVLVPGAFDIGSLWLTVEQRRLPSNTRGTEGSRLGSKLPVRLEDGAGYVMLCYEHSPVYVLLTTAT
jgi:hypothetical protein